MFSILLKPQDSVNAEDLETLQNEIERRLVEVVTQKWELERELLAFSSTSPDLSGPQLKAPKLEPPEITSDGFKGSLFEQQSSNNGGAKGGSSGSNSGEDSVSSEGSIVSNLTSSTIILANPLEPGSQATSVAGSTGTKRSHKNNDRPSKRFRPNGSNSFNPSTGVIFNKRPHHSKHRSKIVPSKFRNIQEESRPHKNQASKNDAPDKLWPFVEQFCATPTEEQIAELQEMIEAADNNNDKEYFRMPALGRKDPTPKDTPTKIESGKSQKKNKPRNGEEISGLGALTQRLVSSLIEEAEDPAEVIGTKKNSDADPPTKKKNSKSKGGKSLDMNNAKNLERRIRQELEEYDILDQQDDIPYSSEEDEILRELIASQHELFTTQCESKELMQRLLKRAKKHVELQNERVNLEEANTDVIAAYYRLIQAKQRKRNPTKKEKDAAWRSLKVHEAIFKKCDDLYLNNLSRNES